jgi:hypothetical protein
VQKVCDRVADAPALGRAIHRYATHAVAEADRRELQMLARFEAEAQLPQWSARLR